MHEKDEQPLQTVPYGPYVGEPMAGELDDTLLYQPGLQVNEDIAIISVLFPRTSSAFITPDTARVDNNTFSVSPPHKHSKHCFRVSNYG